MRLLLFLLVFLLNLSFVQANVGYNAVEYEVVVPTPVEKNKKAGVKKQKRTKKQKNKKAPQKIQYSEYGKVYLIIGLCFLGMAVVAVVFMILFTYLWPAFLIALLMCLALGLFGLIWGLSLMGRNSNWDADYK